MPIYAPSRRINPTIRRRDLSRKTVYASLFLTSMVDMFAILVIFLLQSFSSIGEIIVLPRGLELPKAHNVGVLELGPSLVISREQILFEGQEVAKTQEVYEQTAWAIPKLQESLKAYKEKNKDVALLKSAPETAGDEERFKINISADKRLPFHVIRKVIYNAGYVGFPDFRFAVFAGSDSNTDIQKN